MGGDPGEICSDLYSASVPDIRPSWWVFTKVIRVAGDQHYDAEVVVSPQTVGSGLVGISSLVPLVDGIPLIVYFMRFVGRKCYVAL